ncbi:DMT family transporter [Mesorhizobium xinjiangense]|uniref:DMT family transporter n=1 Tax=Mesorhizobium xinjiangense TaxID=2678685 RepID=UPI0012EE74E3|nr:DMT family transporter [Mesorhizobium xinjiangense]
MTADRPLLGILLMVGFCAMAPLGDSIAKILGDTIPLLQLLLVRFAAQSVLLLPFIRWGGHSLRVTPRVLKLTAIRTLLHIAGIGSLFAALRYLPLADATAIAFVMPFIMLLLGHFVLQEEVGPRRLAACAVGFIGTLLVIQPSFVEVGWPALLPLLVALSFAFYMLVSRQVAKECEPMVLQTISGMMATAGLAALAILTFGSDIPALGMIRPQPRDAFLLAAIGIMGTFAHLLMTWSLRFAPSATLAPMQYLEIPFATFFGWLIFHDLPDGLAALGIAITMGAGLYVIYRERVAASMPHRPAADGPFAGQG